MTSIKQLLKLLLKRVYINKPSQFTMGMNSGVGIHSRLQFSDENSGNATITIGNYAGVGRNCELHVWDNNKIIIKDHSTLNDGCKVLGDVTIERYCVISANLFASSGNHYAFEKPSWLIKDQDEYILNTAEGKRNHSQPILIEEDCWIGVGVFIKQGTYIGRGAVIGANTVVNKDVLPYSVQGGIPNKEIKKRFTFEPLNELQASNDEHLPYFYRGFEHKRNIIEQSRKDKCIYFTSRSLVILKPSHSIASTIITGKNFNQGDASIKLIIDDKNQWEFSVPKGDFTLTLSATNATTLRSKNDLYESLNNDMKKFQVLSIFCDGAPACSIGIESIKQMN